MATSNMELDTLLVQVDDWFSALPLNEPISQFALHEDKVRLATISRTTLNWFKPLTNPPLTNEGINDCSDFTSSDEENPSIMISQDLVQLTEPISIKQIPRQLTVTKKTKRSQQKKVTNKTIKKDEKPKPTKEPATILDTLVRDLELLIGDGPEGEETSIECEQPEMVFQNIYCNDEEALLDSSIGACCTINIAREKLESSDDLDHKKVIFRDHTDHLLDNDLADQDTSSKIQTPLPLDHDYIPRPRRDSIKPLSSNKVFTETKRRDSILNMDALKRFAKFSDKFRVLSMVDC